MTRGRDPAAALIRALKPMLGTFAVERCDSEAWASITFTGARITLVLRVADVGAADRLLLRLPEVEFVLPGHIVADVAAIAEPAKEGVRLTLEALTLEAD